MGAIFALLSIVVLAIALLLQATNSGHNPLAWFIAGVLFYVLSTLLASWSTIRTNIPRA